MLESINVPIQRFDLTHVVCLQPFSLCSQIGDTIQWGSTNMSSLRPAADSYSGTNRNNIRDQAGTGRGTPGMLEMRAHSVPAAPALQRHAAG